MSDKNLKSKDIQKLLDGQTSVILSAVDEKLAKTEKNVDGKLVVMKIDILSEIDKKLVKMELRINQKLDKLTTTLDKFLVRLTKIEDEFEAMKLDINRVKKVIREKLGVEL